MKTTHWVGVRKYLKWTSLIFLLVSLACVWFTIHVSQELMETRQQLIGETQLLTNVVADVKTKQGTIDSLDSTIQRQDTEITSDEALMASWKQKMFNLELTRDIVSYLQKREYDISERRDNFNNIYLTLFYAQKYEGVYKKKYPAWAQFFSWRTCMYIGFLETKLNLTEHNGASAMGEFQILEFNNYKLKDGSINPHPQKFLYPLMCKLGYKKITYGKTLDYFLANPEVQVNCFYYVFMEKLRDSHGDFTSAVVAYNAWQPDPLNSDYWVYYINSQRKFENWFEDVNQKLK